MARRLGTQIHSIKHVVDSFGGLTSTPSVTAFGNAVVTRSAAFDPAEVEVGETVNGFFITVFAIGDSGSAVIGPIDWYIGKSRSAQVQTSDFPDPGATGISPIRNQIFHEEKGLVGSGDGTAMAFKGVIVVPKGMRRMRQGDSFFMKIKTDGAETAQFCFKAIYKSFS